MFNKQKNSWAISCEEKEQKYDIRDVIHISRFPNILTHESTFRKSQMELYLKIVSNVSVFPANKTLLPLYKTELVHFLPWSLSLSFRPCNFLQASSDYTFREVFSKAVFWDSLFLFKSISMWGKVVASSRQLYGAPLKF